MFFLPSKQFQCGFFPDQDWLLFVFEVGVTRWSAPGESSYLGRWMDRPKTGFRRDLGNYTYDMPISFNLMLHISVWSVYLTQGFELRVFSWFISISCSYKHYNYRVTVLFFGSLQLRQRRWRNGKWWNCRGPGPCGAIFLTVELMYILRFFYDSYESYMKFWWWAGCTEQTCSCDELNLQLSGFFLSAY